MATKVSATLQMMNASTDELVQVNLSYINPKYANIEATDTEAWGQIDNIGRRLSALTRDMYVDMVLIRTQSVNEMKNA